MSEITKNLKIVLKGLKYQTLDNFIGREIEVCSLESFESDAFSILGGDLPADSKLISPDRRMLEGAMAKYGLIDAEFSISNRHLKNCPRVNREVLEDLGFIFEKGSEEEFTLDDLLMGFETLVEDVNKNEAFIKLFFEIEKQERIREVRKRFRPITKIPNGFLPQKFVVIDACLTNSDFVWINKHFYL